MVHRKKGSNILHFFVFSFLKVVTNSGSLTTFGKQFADYVTVDCTDRNLASS